MQSLTIRRPDDCHVHLRDGEMLRLVAPFTAQQFGRAIVMPNLVPPVTTVDARVSWQRGPFTAFAYAQNLFDKFHITSWSELRDRPMVQVTTNDSREIGVGIDARF